MSFILDSLEKADQERQRGKIPDLQTRHSASPPPSRNRRLWPYLLVVILLLNAAVLVWWLGPWRKAPPAKKPIATVAPVRHPMPMPPPEKAATSDRSAGETSVRPGTAPVVVSSKSPRAASGEQGEAPPSSAAKLAATGGKAVPAVPAAPNKPASAPVREISPAAKPSPAQPEQPEKPKIMEVYKLDDLPPSVRQGLPELSMALHYYTEVPALRLIRINDKNLREGQLVVSGLKVEEITPDGVVFDWRGFRFRIRQWTVGTWR